MLELQNLSAIAKGHLRRRVQASPPMGELINILCRAEHAESRASRRRLYLLDHCLFNAVAQPHDRLPTRFELAGYGGH
jgi:hypothetical protein